MLYIERFCTIRRDHEKEHSVMDAKEVLEYMAKQLIEYLEELKNSDTKTSGFVYGEKTAYTECLEMIQLWKKAKEIGLDIDIEKKFLL